MPGRSVWAGSGRGLSAQLARAIRQRPGVDRTAAARMTDDRSVAQVSDERIERIYMDEV